MYGLKPDRVEEGRDTGILLHADPFPFPAHQTGRARLEHPAFRQTSPTARPLFRVFVRALQWVTRYLVHFPLGANEHSALGPAACVAAAPWRSSPRASLR